MTGTLGVIVREVYIDALPEEVFPYLTDAAKMVVWKAVGAEIDGRPGPPCARRSRSRPRT